MRFDTRSLTQPLAGREVQVLEARERAGQFGPPHTSRSMGFLVLMAGFGFLAFTLVASFVARIAMNISRGLGIGFGLVMMAALAIAVVVAVRGRDRLVTRDHRTWTLLARFADQNGLHFQRSAPHPDYPGSMFHVGDDPRAYNHVWSDTGLFADVGPYLWTVTDGQNNTHTVTRWFLALRLPQPVPHLVLRARTGSCLPVSFAGDQALSMGQPFDTWFEVFAPSGYGPDAFYLLPPDLMDLLLRAPARFDIELVDRWMFFYTAHEFDMTDPATWRLVEGIEAVIGRRVEAVTDRYRDLRTPVPASMTTAPGSQPLGVGALSYAPRPVDPAGQRLRRSTPRLAGVLVAVVALVIVGMQVLMYLLQH